jgi:hypothetical protein
MNEIKCTKCELWQNEDNFYTRKAGTKYSWCKTCTKENNTKEKSQKYRDENREHFKALKRDSYKRNIVSHMIRAARARAKKFGWEFNLDKTDIIIPDKCPILGIPIIVSHEDKDFGPSIDRIDNNKGYVKDNVIVISYRANRIKRDGDNSDRQKVAEFYRNQL